MEKVKELRYKRTLFVGLGGAGAKTLRILKKKIKAANGGQVPKQVRFLLIDTNSTELSNFRDFDCSEKLCISVREPYQRYLHDKNMATHAFIPEQNAHSLLALERGAGQVRSNGHFAVIENQYSNKLVRVFRDNADAIEDIDINGTSLEKDPKIEVRLVFSIAGGTGSGTFLPIATLLRSAIKHSELTAYIYSATHYSKKVENSAKYSVMQNAYAALCELDYMMHFGRKDRNHENVKFNFGPDVSTQQLEQINRPFEEVYYIDKHTSLPETDSVEFAYNEIDRLQENTAEAMHVASTNIISAHTGTVDNVRQKIMEGQFDVGDKFAWVSGLGIAELYFNPLDEDNKDVINACKRAIKARTDLEGKLPESDIERIASDFIRIYKFDESHGKADKDPILRKFGEEGDIINKCNDIVNKAVSDRAVSDEFGKTIDDFIPQNRKSDTIKEETVASFRDCIDEMLKSLIDYDTFKDNHLKGYEEGLSFSMIKSIIERIREKLNQSITQLKKEKEEHETNQKTADNKIKTLLKNNVPVVEKKKNRWQRILYLNDDTTDNVSATLENIVSLVRGHQKEGLINKILGERDTKAIQVFEGGDSYLDNVNKTLDNWQSVLKMAESHANTKEGHDESYEDVTKHENRVEVQMVELNGGFRLDYKDIERISAASNGGILQSGQAIYDDICKILKRVSGSLQEYLSKGILQINSLVDDKHVKVNRTECQKKIDRLIDLSTPTMQVDRHAFGAKVKDDQFWYIMTDCPETTIAEKSDNTDDKFKSVGELLKNLIEQNTQDSRINLVHVPGWHNKALVYRVVSAVPPYFVNGVCTSEEGGYTLEYCYEELKKTKRTYTPFSHEFLRQKLENGICVLKPHDSIANCQALKYWVDFNLLGYVHFESEKGTKGIYSIKSEKDGVLLTNDFSNHNKILILGESRTEAFETFSRYCKSLLEEYKVYAEYADPFEDKEVYESLVNITGEEYLSQVLINLKWNNREISDWRSLTDHLAIDNPEYKMLRSEMDFVDDRKKKYEKSIEEKNKDSNISDSFKDPDNKGK